MEWRVKQPEREDDHSRPSAAGVKEGGAVGSLAHVLTS
jgi:hypothetical protein